MKPRREMRHFVRPIPRRVGTEPSALVSPSEARNRTALGGGDSDVDGVGIALGFAPDSPFLQFIVSRFDIHNGDGVNLRGLDLNLLPVFEAVFDEGSITRASERLNLTQPAVSNALSRLRAALGDPLFVRSALGVAPTPAAKALIGPVREALARLRSGLDRSAGFDPRSSNRVFNVAMRDISSSIIAPGIAKVLQGMSTEVRFHGHHMDRADIPDGLAEGRLDLAIDIPSLARPELASTPLVSDRYVCVMRKDHPAARGRFDLARFLSLQHIAVSSRRSGKGLVDLALSRMGERLRPVMRLPLYQTGFHVVMDSDFALVAPATLARRYDVAIRELPFGPPVIDLMLFWRRDASADPAIAWAREQVMAAVPQTSAAASGERGGRKR